MSAQIIVGLWALIAIGVLPSNLRAAWMMNFDGWTAVLGAIVWSALWPLHLLLAVTLAALDVGL